MQEFNILVVTGNVVGSPGLPLPGRTIGAHLGSAADPAVGVGGDSVTDSAGKTHLDILFPDIRAQADASVLHAGDPIGETDLHASSSPEATIDLKLDLSGGDLSGLAPPRVREGVGPVQRRPRWNARAGVRPRPVHDRTARRHEDGTGPIRDPLHHGVVRAGGEGQLGSDDQGLDDARRPRYPSSISYKILADFELDLSLEARALAVGAFRLPRWTGSPF